MKDEFDTTLELLHSAKAGDAHALDELLRRYRGRLLGRIRLMMGPRARAVADSDDFVQGVMVDVVKGLDRFEIRDERRFLRWMTEIARNDVRDEVRRKRECAVESLSLSLDEHSGSDRSPLSDALQRERCHRLAEALEELSEDHRTVVTLRQFDGLRFREIARRMERSEKAARALHARALLQLGRVVHQRLGE